MRTLIIDDESRARTTLRNFIGRYAPDLEVVGEAESVSDGVQLIRQATPDLIFLDVQMQDGTGFDLLDMLPSTDFRIIFVTAYDEFALKAFRVKALDYLLKPISPREFMEAVEKCRPPSPTETHSPGSTPAFNEKLVLNTQEHSHVVRIPEIVRCESDNAYTTVFLVNGISILVSKPIKYFEQRLEAHGFFRTHQSHLLNPEYLQKFEKQMMRIVLTNGDQIPVSARKKEQLQAYLDHLA